MKQENRHSFGFFVIAVAALFLAGFLMLVIFGARSYRGIVESQETNMRSRELLSYLSTCVKANDTEGAVSVTESGSGTILTVADGATGYAFRIYLRDGRLLEEYAPTDAALEPERAQEIGLTERFDAALADNGVLTVYTDAGRVLLRLRSEGGNPG